MFKDETQTEVILSSISLERKQGGDCGGRTNQRSDLNDHLTSVCFFGFGFNCTDCGYSSKLKNGVKCHIRKRHGGIVGTVLEKLEYWFTYGHIGLSLGSAKDLLRLSSSKMLYSKLECLHCEKLSSSISFLRVHIGEVHVLETETCSVLNAENRASSGIA